MARTEPGKIENEKAIAELKRDTREAVNINLKDARAGLSTSGDMTYEVIAFDNLTGRSDTIATFYFGRSELNGQGRARILAEELAERINAQ